MWLSLLGTPHNHHHPQPQCHAIAVILLGLPPLPGKHFFFFLAPRRWPARRRLASAMLRRGSPTLPPCACRFPGGAVIPYVRCRGDVAEALSMSSLHLNGQCWRCGASGPSPPPRALGVPLAPLLRSIAANTAWMARTLRLVAVVANEEWQWRR